MKNVQTNLSTYFEQFRKNITGINEVIETAYGTMPLIYTDWTASGRLYTPIEKRISEDFGPFVANTHTKTNFTGNLMTSSYEEARKIIKKHVNANEDDILIMTGQGMTSAINKLQRILGLKVHSKYYSQINFNKYERPIVFVTHMEHHSNQTSWLETIAEVKIIPYKNKNDIDFEAFEELIKKYNKHHLKIASITACSNVTGIQPDYYQIAKLIHQYNGYCFVDFACSAPYVNIDMHPPLSSMQLDAIFFSPHKFLGGPGTPGVLIFNKKLYLNKTPDHPGGGTVIWTNPWKKHKYFDQPEIREDGGTPAFLQTIKTALAIQLKEKMGVENILQREHQILNRLLPFFQNNEQIELLANQHTNRLGVISFFIKDLNHNLAVKMLNDRYGIQTRGGCSCAGTYGHILLNIDKEKSQNIIKEIEKGNIENKPGWIRLSIHPTTSDAEVSYIIQSLQELTENFIKWENDYYLTNGEYYHKNNDKTTAIKQMVQSLFSI